jgi:hypothetical protein
MLFFKNILQLLDNATTSRDYYELLFIKQIWPDSFHYSPNPLPSVQNGSSFVIIQAYKPVNNFIANWYFYSIILKNIILEIKILLL